MKSKSLIATYGLPASGKSTWAKEKLHSNPSTYKRVNRDDLRQMIDDGKWSKSNENQIQKAEETLIVMYLNDDFSVIVDNTHLHPKHLERLEDIALKNGATFQVQRFVTPVDVCIARDKERGDKSVGKKVIMRMYNDFLKPKPYYSDRIVKLDLPDCIICDLDGTLSLLDRNPYDASLCGNDKVCEQVHDTINLFRTFMKKKVIFVTGSPEEYKAHRMEWLDKHDIKYDLYLCRKTGDHRSDDVVKKEIHDLYIKDEYNVYLVLDDRDRVVDMWRNVLGYKTFQVEPGDF